MTNPTQPGQENYGPGTSGHEGSSSAESGAYVAPAQQPYSPEPPDRSAVAYPTAYVPPPDPSAIANPTAYYPPPPGVGYPQQGYGYGAPYGYFGQYPQARATDGMAIASLAVSCAAVLSLCAWGIFGLLLGTLGAIFGHIAKRRIRDSGSGGDGLALAGIIVGWIAAALGLIGVGLLVVVIVLDATGTSY